MLRMALLGLIILLGVGVLSAMELRTPPCSAVAIVPTLAEPNADIFDSPALAKADRLEVAAVSSGTPGQAVLIDEAIALPKDTTVGSSEPPRPIARHPPNPKSKQVTTSARLKLEAKATAIKRTAIVQRSKAASDTEPCRLKAFGGLQTALESADCEI